MSKQDINTEISKWESILYMRSERLGPNSDEAKQAAAKITELQYQWLDLDAQGE